MSKKPVVLSRAEHCISRKMIDPDALKVLYRLNRSGHKAYLVGGAVRDLLLGNQPKDFDIVTDAHPGEIKKLFSNAFLIGRRFRLVHVRFRGGKVVEVATFRREADDDSEDLHNSFGTPEQDAFRRDLTINGLFYDIADFSVIDYVGGLEDLENKRVRVIGEPNKRYEEDPVRMWRVVRHAARNSFAVERRTAAAIAAQKSLLGKCSGARLFEELNKDLHSGKFALVAESLAAHDLWPQLLGEIGDGIQAGLAELAPLYRKLDAVNGVGLNQEFYYTVLLWPWAAMAVAQAPRSCDLAAHLRDAYQGCGVQVTVPKAVLTGVIQIVLIAVRMLEAIETGRLRASLKKRAHYQAASAFVGFLLTETCEPGSDSFEQLVQARHADLSIERPRRRRPRRRRSSAPKSAPQN